MRNSSQDAVIRPAILSSWVSSSLSSCMQSLVTQERIFTNSSRRPSLTSCSLQSFWIRDSTWEERSFSKILGTLPFLVWVWHSYVLHYFRWLPIWVLNIWDLKWSTITTIKQWKLSYQSWRCFSSLLFYAPQMLWQLFQLFHTKLSPSSSHASLERELLMISSPSFFSIQWRHYRLLPSSGGLPSRFLDNSCS